MYKHNEHFGWGPASPENDFYKEIIIIEFLFQMRRPGRRTARDPSTIKLN